jgi:hypothetical protein
MKVVELVEGANLSDEPGIAPDESSANLGDLTGKKT